MFFMVACALMWSYTSYADAASYSVAPLVMNETFDARDIEERVITITNTAAYMQTLYPSVNNISIDGGGKMVPFVTPVESDRSSSLTTWIEFSRKGIDIAPGATVELPVTFRIHPEPKAGVYHAFIGFGTGRNRDEAEAQVARGDAPGVVVTVTIADTKHTIMSLRKFFIERFVTGDNNVATYIFHNTGDEAVTPAGEIILYDSRGKEVGQAAINPDRYTIMPNEEHTFATPLPTESLFGRYKGFLTVTYGRENVATVYDTTFFYALPFHKILIGSLVVILMMGSISWYIHKRYYGSDDNDDSEILTMRVRAEASIPQAHDIDLKQK